MNSLSFLNDLNEEQKSAVIYCDSPQLILSGAGSGKTRVLTYKICYLIKEKKIYPENILALTFTKDAADEMKGRISNLIGKENSRNIKMGTFHSIFLRILRTNIYSLKTKKYKYDSNFKIINEYKAKKLIKKLLKNQFYENVQKIFEKKGINDKNNYSIELTYLIARIVKKIKLLKNKGITYKDYKNDLKEIEKDEKRGLEFFKNIYKEYCKKCLKKNYMDFEDLLLNTYLLFKNDNKVLIHYQNKIDYILIDEYQDTNHIQFEILKQLSEKKKKICVVGDDYQSIYSFRGADINNFFNFTVTFKNYRKFELLRNYRSTPNIVNIGSQLIKNNRNQMKKDLFSNITEENEKINILKNEDDNKESENIGDIIKKLISEQKCKYKDIAILYRKNIQSYTFQKIFSEKNIPYIVNKDRLYESKVIQIILNYLKYIINPNLDNCLKKIINYPPRNIKEDIQNKLFSLAKSKNISCWEIIKNCDNKDKIKEFKIDEDLQKGLLSFKTIIIKLQSMIQNKRVYGIVDTLIEYIKLKEYLKKDLSSLGKINTFLERINEIEEEYIFEYDLKKFTLNDFLNITTQNYDNNNINEKDAVHFLTIHRAKGLEFKYVFIVGFEEGYYPCCSCFDEEIEEERRVLYVAITRAKTNCYISYANYRMIGEQKVKRTESRFLREIYYENIVQKIDTLNNDKNFGIENNYKQNKIQNIIGIGNNIIIPLDENKDMNSNINISKDIIKNGRINESRYKNDKDIKFLNIKRKNEK